MKQPCYWNSEEYKENGMQYKFDVLVHESKHGYEYAILDLGTHPCAYVSVCSNVDVVKKHIDDFDVHGGITYCQKGLRDIIEEDKYVIGWDYAHVDDYVAPFGSYGKKWTTEEIMEDVNRAMDMLQYLESLND